MSLDELRADLRGLLDDAFADLAGRRAPLQPDRLACLIALGAEDEEGAHEVVVEEVEARGGQAAADVLAAMARVWTEPLAGAARAAAGRLEEQGVRPRGAPAAEIRRVVVLDADASVLVAAELHADGGAFALTVRSDGDGVGGGLGDPASPGAVAAALRELRGAREVPVQDGASTVARLLADAAARDLPTDEGLAVDGPLVVHLLGLPPEAWPTLDLRED